VSFIHNKGKGIAQGLQSLEGKIAEADREFTTATKIPTGVSKEQALGDISWKMAGFTQPKQISSMGFHAPRIYTFLGNVKNFVQQNNLTKEDISRLKQELRNLCSMPIIECSNGNFSMNECDCDFHCHNIALQAESLEMLLDAKACDQVGLERNVPPKVIALGSGLFNTVQLAHTQKDGKGPIALKPCDLSKMQGNPAAFARGAAKVRSQIGTVGGSYRRNQATARVQAMFDCIGLQKGIGVPHVIASVSAAEMNGVPCIAMEALEGRTVGEIAKVVKEGGIQLERQKGMQLINEFICRETWMQIQDVLTGQMNRRGDNVMLTGDGLPVAIDHDLSFPTNPPRNFAGIVPTMIAVPFRTQWGPMEAAIDGKSPGNYCMPPVIDREMYDVIMAIDLPRLEATYRDCGLTRTEISAAMARAKRVKAVAQERKEAGRVIEPNQWGSSQLVTQYCDMRNFYAARHLAGG
jgi:hypothetical protein